MKNPVDSITMSAPSLTPRQGWRITLREGTGLPDHQLDAAFRLAGRDWSRRPEIESYLQEMGLHGRRRRRSLKATTSTSAPAARAARCEVAADAAEAVDSGLVRSRFHSLEPWNRLKRSLPDDQTPNAATRARVARRQRGDTSEITIAFRLAVFNFRVTKRNIFAGR